MHEQTTARKIVEDAIEKAAGFGKIRKIKVECGELANIPAKDIEQTLREIAPCTVEVVEAPATAACGNCGHAGHPQIELHSHDASVYFCRKCGAVPTLVKGKDIILKSVEVDYYTGSAPVE